MERKIKVHVADDHMVLIEGIIAMLNTDDDIEVVGYSQTGVQVLEWLKTKKADVLIIDVSMPEKDGVTVLKELQAEGKEQKSIVLSSFDDTGFVQELTTYGISGFIAKTSAGDHLIKAIKTVYNGGSYFTNEIKDNLINLMVGKSVPEGLKPGKGEELMRNLTERELAILKMIAQEYNTVEIAEALKLSVHTVATYRKSILEKLKIKSVVGLALFAVKNNVI